MIDNSLDLVFIFSFNNLRWWSRQVWPMFLSGVIRRQQCHMKHGMYLLFLGKFKFECDRS